MGVSAKRSMHCPPSEAHPGWDPVPLTSPLARPCCPEGWPTFAKSGVMRCTLGEPWHVGHATVPAAAAGAGPQCCLQRRLSIPRPYIPRISIPRPNPCRLLPSWRYAPAVGMGSNGSGNMLATADLRFSCRAEQAGSVLVGLLCSASAGPTEVQVSGQGVAAWVEATRQAVAHQGCGGAAACASTRLPSLPKCPQTSPPSPPACLDLHRPLLVVFRKGVGVKLCSGQWVGQPGGAQADSCGNDIVSQRLARSAAACCRHSSA